MPVYEWRCPDCGGRIERVASMHDVPATIPCGCGGLSRRVFHPPAVHRQMGGHFNTAVGSYVAGDRAFRDALARKSEQMSARTGLEHRYAPIDPREAEPPGAREQRRKREIERHGLKPKTIF